MSDEFKLLSHYGENTNAQFQQCRLKKLKIDDLFSTYLELIKMRMKKGRNRGDYQTYLLQKINACAYKRWYCSQNFRLGLK